MAPKKRAPPSPTKAEATGAVREVLQLDDAGEASIPRTDELVFLWVPNLIGYLRIVLAGISLSFMSYHPKYCTILYCISCLLDAVDGQAARALNQTSKFGAVLDMVTDRCTTSCLLCFLSSAYPAFAILFQALITLDFSSHYIHMYSTLVSGSKSHKAVTRKQSYILWSYYNDSKTLFFYCAGNEMFFVALYLIKWYKRPIGLDPTVLLAYLPPDAIKLVPFTVWNAIRLLTWPQLVAFLTFPICATKQVINCVQFWKAAKALVESDQEERWRKLNA